MERYMNDMPGDADESGPGKLAKVGCCSIFHFAEDHPRLH